MNLGELADDGTLPHTFKFTSITAFLSAFNGDAVLSYHCFLLAEEVRWKKGLVEEGEARPSLWTWKKWLGDANYTVS